MSNLNETLDLIKSELAKPSMDTVAKAGIDVATGLINYNLEAPAKTLIPSGEIVHPLRNLLPRTVNNNGGSALRWKAFTSYDSANQFIGVSEGARGGVTTPTVVDKLSPFVSMGIESSLTFEAFEGASGLDDGKARMIESAMRSLFIAEEKQILLGNSTMVLGTTPTPTLVAGTSGSMPTTATLSVICVALTGDGIQKATVTNGVVQQITRTNADGSSSTIPGGCAIKSASATVSVTGPNGSVVATIVPTKGSFGYAWFTGAVGTERLAQITTVPKATLTAIPTTTQLASALASTDYSALGGYTMDGLLSQTLADGSNGYYKCLNATLTSDGAGGIVQFEEVLASLYDSYKVVPTTIWMSSAEMIKVNALLIANGGAPLFRFNGDANGNRSGLTAGSNVGQYLSKLFGSLIEIRVHPYMPAGTVYFHSQVLPYPVSNVGQTTQIVCLRDTYGIEWPLRSRRYEFGVYQQQALVSYSPFANAVLTGIL